jgi:GH15 family glucan-1,4-alpha-glucosidase
MNPWGSEYTEWKTYIKVNPKGYFRDFTLEDWLLDISLIGLAVPFGMYAADDPKMTNTVGKLTGALSGSPAGGLKRYENDGYIGGNPWVISTLWMALYCIELKDYNKAREYLEWTVTSRSKLGLLPEQADRDSGKPAWVLPLTWSHAMYVLVYSGLHEAGAL